MDQIAADKYAVGSLLPTEAELCVQFGVSRTTLREAVRWLRDHGVVSTRPGIGTRVLARRPRPQYVHAVESISDVFQYTKDSHNPKILSVSEREAGADEAELLKCAIGQRWLRLELTRTFRGDKVPILYSEVYVPHAYAAVAELIPTRSAPVYTLLESEFGEAILAVEQEFKSIRLKARAARNLKLSAGAPSLSVVRHYFGSGDRLLLVTASLYHPDHHSYKMRLRFNPRPSDRMMHSDVDALMRFAKP